MYLASPSDSMMEAGSVESRVSINLTKNCKANESLFGSLLGIAILETQIQVETQLCSEVERKGQSL